MGNEITATDKRAAMLKQMRPSSEQLGSDALAEHRAAISFELERVSSKIDRFGWGQMSNRMKDSLTEDWADVLDPYRLEEVKAACSYLLGENPKLATNEQQVKKVIHGARAKAFAKLPKQSRAPESERELATAEQRAAILAENGFRELPGAKLKRMGQC